MGNLLTLDVVPETCHFSNLRTELPKKTWDRLRRKAYRAAGFRCLICGRKGDNHPVEAHEKWDYNLKGPEGPVQTLVEIQALCPACHEVKHYGLAQVKGRDAQARAHLAEVNGWSELEVREHIRAETVKYEDRSTVYWDLDVSVINDDESALKCWDRRREKNKVAGPRRAPVPIPELPEVASFIEQIKKDLRNPDEFIKILMGEPFMPSPTPPKPKSFFSNERVPEIFAFGDMEKPPELKIIKVLPESQFREQMAELLKEDSPEPKRVPHPDYYCRVCGSEDARWIRGESLDLYCDEHKDVDLAVPQVEDSPKTDEPDPLEGFKWLA